MINDIVNLIIVISEDRRLPIPSDCPYEWSQLIQTCWEGEPEKRPTFNGT